MAILYYLAVLITASGKSTIKDRDFDTFALEAKLESGVSCQQFLQMKDRDSYAAKVFKIQAGSRIEYKCLTPSELEDAKKEFLKKSGKN